MKYALIIGNTRYTDPKLAQLKTPAADSQALARVLKDQSIGAFDEVIPLVNKTEVQVSRAISAFLTNKKPEDLVLVYFSGHGVLDDRGRLFLALKDTQTYLLKSTAIGSSFVADEMDSCRSKRQILILDCCHSGAFARGTKGAQKAVTETTFEGTGFGRVVLTASDSTQYALEGDQVIEQTELSLFTHFLLEGLKTGEADVNNDGLISLDEWYDYTYAQVLSTTPRQIPHKWSYHQQGDLVIAKNPRYELMKREAAERTAREESERVRREKERIEREVAQRIAWEKAEREAIESAAREETKHEAVEKATREMAEYEATGKATQEKEGEPPKSEPQTANVRKAKPQMIIAGIVFLMIIVAGTLVSPALREQFFHGNDPEITRTVTFVPTSAIPISVVQPTPGKQLKVAFVLDTSGIMEVSPKFNSMLDATSSSISKFRENEELAVFSFNETVTLDIDVTNDFNSAFEQVRSIKAVPSSSVCLYDAVYEVLQKVSTFDDPNWVIVVIADGRDRNSRGEICSQVKIDDVVSNIMEKQAPNPVYIIALGNYYIQEDILRSISKLTGGSFTLADSTELGTMLLELLDQLRISRSNQNVFTPSVESTSTAAPTNTPAPLSTEITDDRGVEMASVPAGEFTFGSKDYEKTMHLDTFLIDKYEVTNSQYAECVLSGKCKSPAEDKLGGYEYYGNPEFKNFPVVWVSSDMALIYCQWRGARLPTASEWEKAARGNNGFLYPWGNDLDDVIRANSYGTGDGYQITSPVGSFPGGASPFGVHDMAGNVSEWVANRVTMGSSWRYGDMFMFSGAYDAPSSVTSSPELGFRCAKDANP